MANSLPALAQVANSLPALASHALGSARQMTAGSAMTVLGRVPAQELGITLMHEHIILDGSCWLIDPASEAERHLLEAPVELANLAEIRREPTINRHNFLLDDIGLAARELARYADLGGRTIVDLTLDEFGRNPVALRDVAVASGLHVICGCGHYVALYHQPWLETATVSDIARQLIDELTTGIRDTGVRAGIIGEIGTSNPTHPREKKVLRAAALAQQETGAAITIHVDTTCRRAHEVLDLLESAGADLHGVILGHLDATLSHLDMSPGEAVEYHRTLGARGCYIEYDLCGTVRFTPAADQNGSGGFGTPSDRERAVAIAELIENGLGAQVLLSHDVSSRSMLTEYGGHGYGHLLRDFVGVLGAVGVREDGINRLLTDNPRSALAWTN